MLLEDTEVGDSRVLRLLEKRLDASIAHEFKNNVCELIDAGSMRIILNLSAAEFIDSAGLGALLTISNRIGTNGSFIICGIQEPALHIIKLTKLDKIFEIVASETEAINASHTHSTCE